MGYTIVEYYLKGEGKMAASFKTYAEAQAYMKALNDNPNCESYGVARRGA